MVINRQQTTTRQMKALTIVGQNDQIKRINSTNYKVKSQSSDFWYDVTRVPQESKWNCSCPDHIFRNLDCKHIQAVLISKELRNKIVTNTDVKEIETQSDLICKCGSIYIVKHGIRHNKSGNIQRFRCKVCNHKWSDNLGFAKAKVNSKIITVALDLYFKGVSLRKVSEHLKLFYGISISNVAVLGWIRKFGEVVTPFVDQLIPKQIFVAHGKNKKPLEQLKTVLDQFQVPYKVAIDEPHEGRPVSQKVSELMHECSSAIFIFTKDEETKDSDGNVVYRPSDNVVFELGAASVLYGKKIVIFKENGVSFGSDFKALGYIPFDTDQLGAKTVELMKELIGFGLLKISAT